MVAFIIFTLLLSLLCHDAKPSAMLPPNQRKIGFRMDRNLSRIPLSRVDKVT